MASSWKWLAAAALLAAGAGCTVDARDRDGDEITIELPDSGPPGICGPNVCAPGEVCCNESCGICTKPNGLCTQQLCGPEATPHLIGDHDMDGDIDGRDRPNRTVRTRDVPAAAASDWDWADPMRFDRQ